MKESDRSATARYPINAMYFDSQWYLQAYPDVLACGMDAVEHFMTHGYLEGRDPNAFFRSRSIWRSIRMFP